MQIVIEIDKDQYEQVKQYSGSYDFGNAIANGVVLPENHGRLIDADSLWDLYHDNDYDFYESIDSATTIIEGTEGKE